MLILDTDHLTILAHQGAEGRALAKRLVDSGLPSGPTAVSAEEVLRGWLGKISGTRLAANQVRYYGKLQASVEKLGRMTIMPFDAGAADRF